ncbi:MAG: hypothetical protein ACI92Z_003126 [Paracoccaceae bacterium]|jgi:hypothetical protein
MAAAVKSDLNDIQHAETRSEAEAALEMFAEKYKLKIRKRRKVPDQRQRRNAGVLRLSS